MIWSWNTLLNLKDNKGDRLMEREIVVVALFVIFLIAAILPRIIQKRKKVETVGCIGIDSVTFHVIDPGGFQTY